MDQFAQRAGSRATVPVAILAVVVAYVVALAMGWPQRGTQLIVDHQVHPVAAPEADAGAPEKSSEIEAPPFWTVIPFVLLLAGIAVLPLIPATAHQWESNLNRFKVAGGLALLTLAYYLFLHRQTIEGHWPAHHLVVPAEDGLQVGLTIAILRNAILQEFIPFIVLLFSLYTISGGIRITGDLQAHPMTNAMFMGVGALLASFIGTTGAAMLLIRPLLETNRDRKHIAHTIVFFIFIVCNCGGLLLPIGDPPLFLGYLEGVPFLWTLRLWPEWLFVNGLLLVMYLLLDGLWHYRREALADIQRDAAQTRQLAIDGWQVNVPLLVGVVLAVALLDPSKPLPSTDWHPWMYLREVVQLCLVATSLLLGSRRVRDANLFSYGAIIEVAALFVGIFICMQPALQILGVKGDELGLDTPAQFFWATGSLSSVLDNAPTYLVFFKTAQAMPAHEGATLVAGVDENILAAISLGAVFMGAMTYIGNGPNFMVRAIAESSGVKMPSFFGYMVYSFLILLPLFALTVWRFLMQRLGGTPKAFGAGRGRGREDIIPHPSPGAQDVLRAVDVGGQKRRLSTALRFRYPVSHSQKLKFGSDPRRAVTHQTITSSAQLADFCRRLSEAKRIGIDTEFVSEDTFRPELCLVQVATEKELAVIDPYRVKNLADFWRTLAGGEHRTIAHAAREELNFSLLECNEPPANLFDTQIAAGLCSTDYPSSYGAVVMRFLNREAVKGEQRTDWRRRPLSDAQIDYALEDVRYLLPLDEVLQRHLQRQNRLGWLAEEMSTWLQDVRESRERPRWRKVSGIGGLSSRSLAIVKQLWLWRQREAERRDVPPRRILRDDLIVELAKRKSDQPDRIRQVRGMQRGLKNDVIEQIAACVHCGLEAPLDDDEKRLRQPMPSQLNLLGQFLSPALTSICRSANVATSLAGTATDVRDLIAYRLEFGDLADDEPPLLARGWRAELVGNLIDELISGKKSIRITDPLSEQPLGFDPVDDHK